MPTKTRTAKKRSTKKRTGKNLPIRLNAEEYAHLVSIQKDKSIATMNKAIVHVLCNYQSLEEQLLIERQKNRSLNFELEETKSIIYNYKISFNKLMTLETE